MSFMGSMTTSATGMTAQQLRTDLISQNLANVNTTRDENGEPYRRKIAVFKEKTNNGFGSVLNRALGTSGEGVKVSMVAEDMETDMKMVYDPSHPDADANGYVTYPNVDTVTEMTNMIDATRSYEANVTAFNASKQMLLKTLEIGK
ncbi:MAG: flagellar basal body rod protein FlgC [Lachnospiraceae bacterium]|nr:flagellar basal body rod protein FlgC [Lachnospiraceae bacterium]